MSLLCALRRPTSNLRYFISSAHIYIYIRFFTILRGAIVNNRTYGVHKTYQVYIHLLLYYFHEQHMILFTMAPRNSAVVAVLLPGIKQGGSKHAYLLVRAYFISLSRG